MAQVVKPSEVQIITKNGELQINLKLDININLNQSDIMSLNKNFQNDNKSQEVKELEEKAKWEIPDFGPSPKLKFGK